MAKENNEAEKQEESESEDKELEEPKKGKIFGDPCVDIDF
jgi:hypothetical protein